MSAPRKPGGGGWLSGALANLESRLDTILADDVDASAKQQGAEQQGQTNIARSNSARLTTPADNALSSTSRSNSKSRINDRLAERLAKATAQKPPSRIATPVDDAAMAKIAGDADLTLGAAKPLPEIAVKLAAEEDPSQPEVSVVDVKDKEDDTEGAIHGSKLPANSISAQELARASMDSSRASADLSINERLSQTSLTETNGLHSASQHSPGNHRMSEERSEADIQRQEEMHMYLERIDALQAKLTYLANETVAAAKEANAAAAADSLERQIATKDERIALLMEEGEKLSKSEMQRMQTIKKLRMQAVEEEKAMASLRKQTEILERSEADLKAKLQKAQIGERQANTKLQQVASMEKQVDELRNDRANATELIQSLAMQLQESKNQVSKAELEIKKFETDRGKIAELQNELEDALIEKKLAEERSVAEIKRSREEFQRQFESLTIHEMELKSEISGLESRLEALRARAEEASSNGRADGGESNVKLLRQVETLQQQYALAKSNWQTIEGSLNARVAVLEKEKDDVTRRESELRKRARDVSNKSRKVEEQLEGALERLKQLEEDYQGQQVQMGNLQAKLDQSESSQHGMRAEFELQREMWESECLQRLEDERAKWRRDLLGSSPHLGGSPRPESPALFGRKASGFDVINRKPLSRLASHDLVATNFDQRPGSRRSSAVPLPGRVVGASADASPSISRQDSNTIFEHNPMSPTSALDNDVKMHESEDFDHDSSPQRTIHELVSISTAGPGAGPSVQLVERMSLLVRRLESEKASFKDELGRLSAQRDDARGEVVALLREVESKRNDEARVTTLEEELSALQHRYEASLEMLGEKEEQVDELKSDVVELKRIYRELIEAKLGASA